MTRASGKPKPGQANKRSRLVITAMNKPDPDITAQAILPLLFDWMKCEREKVLAKDGSSKK